MREKDFYSELWSRLPGPGAKIKTEQGIYVLESLELGREYVNIRFPNGRLVPVSITEFPDFQETILKGEEWGEDKELSEKKKAAAARIAALKEKSLLRKAASSVKASPRLAVNAMSLRPNLDKGKVENPKPIDNQKFKAKPTKQKQKQQNQTSKPKRHFKPHNKKPQ